tara:strand:- start:1421 stop:2044 length:624 start_codon:yes stop_codon:yes gene_type:complete
MSGKKIKRSASDSGFDPRPVPDNVQRLNEVLYHQQEEMRARTQLSEITLKFAEAMEGQLELSRQVAKAKLQLYNCKLSANKLENEKNTLQTECDRERDEWKASYSEWVRSTAAEAPGGTAEARALHSKKERNKLQRQITAALTNEKKFANLMNRIADLGIDDGGGDDCGGGGDDDDNDGADPDPPYVANAGSSHRLKSIVARKRTIP